MLVSEERVDEDSREGVAFESTGSSLPDDADVTERYLRSWQKDRSFWGEMPDRQWSLEWVGWPKQRPRHSRRRVRWPLALTVGLCATFALCLLIIR